MAKHFFLTALVGTVPCDETKAASDDTGKLGESIKGRYTWTVWQTAIDNTDNYTFEIASTIWRACCTLVARWWWDTWIAYEHRLICSAGGSFFPVPTYTKCPYFGWFCWYLCACVNNKFECDDCVVVIVFGALAYTWEHECRRCVWWIYKNRK